MANRNPPHLKRKLGLKWQVLIKAMDNAKKGTGKATTKGNQDTTQRLLEVLKGMSYCDAKLNLDLALLDIQKKAIVTISP